MTNSLDNVIKWSLVLTGVIFLMPLLRLNLNNVFRSNSYLFLSFATICFYLAASKNDNKDSLIWKALFIFSFVTCLIVAGSTTIGYMKIGVAVPRQWVEFAFSSVMPILLPIYVCRSIATDYLNQSRNLVLISVIVSVVLLMLVTLPLLLTAWAFAFGQSQCC